MSIPALQQAWQKFLEEIPHHGLMKVYEYFSEANEKRKREYILAATTTMAAFLDAVTNRSYEEAGSLCSPELRQIMATKRGLTETLDLIRAHLTHTIDWDLTGRPSLTFLGTGCHLSGIINYTADRSAHFTLDAVKQQSEWKIVAYSFDAVPSLALTTPPLSKKSPVYQSGKAPTKTGRCPKGYPIKGSVKNIYHLPGGRFYGVTSPVRCFASEDEAKVAGFRPSQH